jgi:hypothetical protein
MNPLVLLAIAILVGGFALAAWIWLAGRPSGRVYAPCDDDYPEDEPEEWAQPVGGAWTFRTRPHAGPQRHSAAIHAAPRTGDWDLRCCGVPPYFWDNPTLTHNDALKTCRGEQPPGIQVTEPGGL